MALLMTVFFENGFSENYFPNVDNRNFPIAIRPYVSGLKEELVLLLDETLSTVLDGSFVHYDQKLGLIYGEEEKKDGTGV